MTLGGGFVVGSCYRNVGVALKMSKVKPKGILVSF